MTARRCVFCGGSPLTNEDVYPEWLQPYLTTPGSLVSRRWGAAESLVGVDTKNADVKVRRVCATCNNGWMSALEGRAKLLLLPLVQGQVNQLRYADQQLIATWATNTAMMLQFTPIYNDGLVIHPRLYRELYAHQAAPPTAMVVWMGQEAQQPPPGALFSLRGMMIEHVEASGLVPVRRRYLGFEATMIARHLILKVMGHSGPGHVKILDTVVAPAYLDLIWPVRVSGGILLTESESR